MNLAAADVYIMTSQYILDPLPDIPADFGPDIPDAGIEGILRSADPEDACSPFTFKDFDTPWIALIARQQQLHPNNCTFDVKVWNAQNAGAMAAIVYDDVYESLIIMSKPKGHPDPFIPSVFVSQKAGIIMKKLMTIDTIRVRITPMSSVAWLSMLMSAFLGVLALGVVLATFYVMRSWSMWLTGMHVRGGGPGAGAQGGQTQARPAPGPQQEPGLPAESLRLLPVVVFEPSVSSRGSRIALGTASGPGGGAAAAVSSSQPGSASAVGAAVWSEEAVGDEEMRPLLQSGGDVEEGCGGSGYEEEEAEDHEVASQSSSESCCSTAAAAAARLPRPPGAHAGETKRVCAICLESYVEGEKVRVLPCAHRFHMGCVDQWLGSRRYCPVCKHDASQPLPHTPAPSRAGAGAAGSGRAGAGGGGAASAGGVNGWTLVFQALVDLLRHPRVVSRSRPNANQTLPQLQQQQQQRTRTRRQQSQVLPSPRAAAAPPELQEPLVPSGASPQPAVAAAPSIAPPPAGDVEAPGPSRPSSAVAVAAAPAGSSSTSAPISIPANAGSSVAAAAAEPAARRQQQPQRQAGPAAAGGPAARVRAVLAGLWGSGAAGGAAGPSGAPQYPSTL